MNVGSLHAPATVAVLIKTYGRDLHLITCVRSVEAHIGVPCRFYIADDGPVSAARRALYARLEAAGHRILLLDAPTAVTVARNRLVGLLADEPYVLRLDDDFELTRRTRVDRLIAILEDNADIGAVSDLERQIGDGKGIRSGEISPGQGFLERRDGVMLKHQRPPRAWRYQRTRGIRFARCDVSRNFLLIRRAVFDSVRWEERLFINGEHIDFMLSLQAAGWRLAFTPDSVHNHREDLPEPQRWRHLQTKADTRAETDDVLREKWGFGSISSRYPRGYRLRRRLDRLVRGSPCNERRGVIVELVGSPGAGKSTLVPAAIGALVALGIRAMPAAEARRVCAARSGFWRRTLGTGWGRLMDCAAFFLRYRPAARRVLAWMLRGPAPWRQRWRVLRWLLRDAGDYALFNRHLQPGEAAVMEEGLVQRATSLFATPGGTPPREVLEQYLESVPPPGLLLWVQRPIDACLFAVAAAGRQRRYQGDALAAFTRHSEKIAAAAAEYLLARGVEVIVADNGGDPAAAAVALRQQLHSRLAAEAPRHNA